jgi:hypothetical protein
MIVKQANKYVVMDTETKEIISEHPFQDNKKSMAEAEEAARKSNARWKETK